MYTEYYPSSHKIFDHTQPKCWCSLFKSWTQQRSYPAFAQLANKEKFINVFVRRFGLVLEILIENCVFALQLTLLHNAATSRDEVNKKLCEYHNTI